MSFRLTDKGAFKISNLENWRNNATFWLEGRMRHLEDVGDAVRDRVLRLMSSVGGGLVLDMGCGDGWLLRRVREKSTSMSYVGLDFNDLFISALRHKHRSDQSASFDIVDFERATPEEMKGIADVVVNCFNFFELPQLREGFAFAASALRPGGHLLAVTIDPIMQMLSITNTREELDGLLQAYELEKDTLAYDKEIDVGGEHTGRVYKAVMYSAADFVAAGTEAGLTLTAYDEVIVTRPRAA